MRPSTLIAPIALCALAFDASAELRLPHCFGDHMLFQAGAPIRVWGTCEPGREVRVRLGERAGSARSGSDGRFVVELASLEPGGPYRLEVEADETRAFEDVLVGELWLCSGQSNMEWQLAQSQDAEVERSAADHPRLRLFHVEHAMPDEPQEDVGGSWSVCTPESAHDFSAVGYHFGRELLEALDRPIGLVQSTWGGTRAEAWTSRDDLRANAELAQLADNPQGHGGPNRPGVLFDGMIHPLLHASFRGAVWYQGESNCSDAEQYATLFPAMIAAWRKRFANDVLAFYFVQIAPYDYHASGQLSPEACAVLRESQLATLALPHTGVVVTMDVGNPKDIHPRDKRTVGHRLALWALAKEYGRGGECSGPLFASASRDGAAVRVAFEHAAGLRTRDGAAPSFLELAGADGAFRPAQGKIEGDALIVTCSEVSDPTAVRYAFRDDAEPNLENGAGLPASPFRASVAAPGAKR